MEEKYSDINYQVEYQANLLDCYRIALDFGLPAAERAFAIIDEGSAIDANEPQPSKNQSSPAVVDTASVD